MLQLSTSSCRIQFRPDNTSSTDPQVQFPPSTIPIQQLPRNIPHPRPVFPCLQFLPEDPASSYQLTQAEAVRSPCSGRSSCHPTPCSGGSSYQPCSGRSSCQPCSGRSSCQPCSGRSSYQPCSGRSSCPPTCIMAAIF